MNLNALVKTIRGADGISRDEEGRIDRDDLQNYQAVFAAHKKLIDFRLRRGKKQPYALFGMINLEKRPSGTTAIPSIFELRLGPSHSQISKIEYYLRKGMKLLDFWIPTTADLPPKRDITESGWVVRLRNSDSDPYADVRAYLENQLRGQSAWESVNAERRQMLDENEALRARVTELQSKIVEPAKKREVPSGADKNQ